MRKIDRFWLRLLIDFGSLLGLNLGLCSAMLTPKRRPRGPQDAPRGPQDAPKWPSKKHQDTRIMIRVALEAPGASGGLPEAPGGPKMMDF